MTDRRIAEMLDVRIALEPGESPDAYLARVLPPATSVFWPSDRF